MIAGNRRFQTTEEESIQLDDKRVRLVGRILSGLGFQEERHLRHDSKTGPGQFTDCLVYRRPCGDPEGLVSVSFPNQDEAERGTEITVEAEYYAKSKQWGSLREFEEDVASWMEECRGSS